MYIYFHQNSVFGTHFVDILKLVPEI